MPKAERVTRFTGFKLSGWWGHQLRKAVDIKRNKG